MPQIEEGLLSVVSGLERFHYYVHGIPVIAQVAQKPLSGLLVNMYDTTSPRLQILLLRLQKYDVRLNYVRRKDLIVADAVSRAPLDGKIAETDANRVLGGKVAILIQASSNTVQSIPRATEVKHTSIRYFLLQKWLACDPRACTARVSSVLGLMDCQSELLISEVRCVEASGWSSQRHTSNTR